MSVVAGGASARADEAGPVALVAFMVDDRRFALPLSAVERALPMVAVTPLPRAPAVVLGTINVHGRIVAVVDVRLRLGLPPREPDPRAQLLLAATARRTLAMAVDEVLGVIEVEPSAVADPAAVMFGIGHVAGLVALPDGLLVVEDLEAFLTPEEGRMLDGAGA